jgi:hypothetical protein
MAQSFYPDPINTEISRQIKVILFTLGISEISIEFEGTGDSGGHNITSILLSKGNLLEPGSAEFEQLQQEVVSLEGTVERWVAGEGYREVRGTFQATVSDVARLAVQWLSPNYNNEGCQGTLHINLSEIQGEIATGNESTYDEESEEFIEADPPFQEPQSFQVNLDG